MAVNVPAPQPVALTAEEQSLLDEIDFELSGSRGKPYVRDSKGTA